MKRLNKVKERITIDLDLDSIEYNTEPIKKIDKIVEPKIVKNGKPGRQRRK